ncbi:LPS-assembly protein LptD [Endozoicomonas sp. GU-1]|uniref:LPS-assembly protein LptD n=1 Tax=Endozoicomonas sp. GU-1 TaxID=3009078 RepID=UPI0022B5029B|nr:LPS-assembly protein LptD [Endozoicomonas sp. GU-1]WBA82740.1 LPS-assembly protein LptD [Endozoicomonas sp. GU-1]WBA85671.1 LPS-assembly protein LptD [Endozoicomonas sp. GU-1]
MDMHLLPFTPKALTLVIATSIIASQPAARVIAAEPSGAQQSEWHCQTLANGHWSCHPATGKSKPAQPKPGAKQQVRNPKKSTTPIKPATNGQNAALKQQLDWQPIRDLSAQRRSTEPFYSCGAYIEPPRPGKDYSGDSNNAPIVAESNESSYDKDSVATFKGDVTVRQGSRQFESDHATLDKSRNHGQFEGNVRFRDSGVLLVGDKGDLQLDSGRATLENTAYVMHEQKARGSAKRIVRNEDTTLELSDATYTTCPPGDKGWQLSGQQVTLDMGSGQGLAKNAVVRVQGLPILYTPYLSFPIDDRRKSGFLYPTLSQSSDNGLDFAIPYYLNIAPNYDATLTPRYMSKRGLMLENEFRYLVGNTRGELGLSGLLDKDQLKKENPYYNDQRWLLNYRQQTNLTSRWTAEVDYAKASDKNYLDDFSTSLNLSANAPLNQRIGTRYLGGDTNHSWQFSVDAHQYQNMNQTADDPYNKLPQIKLSGNWLASSRLNLNYVADYTKFSRDDNWHYVKEESKTTSDNEYFESVYDEGYGIKSANGERLYLETGAGYSFDWSYAFIRPAVKVQHVEYRLTDLSATEVETDLNRAYGNFTAADYTESPKTTVPTFSIDSGFYFDRFTNIGGTEFTHTLEPRMKYLYSPYKEGQEMNPVFDTALMNFNYNSLWRDSRFSGHDRLGDANQLSLGLTTRLIEGDGFERVRFGIGQIIYFEDRQLWISPIAGIDQGVIDQDLDTDPGDETRRLLEEMQDSVSPLASELVYNINRSMNIRQDLMWDTSNNKLDSYGLYYQYQPGDRRVMNAGYRFLRQADRFVKNELDQNTGLTTDNNLSQTDLSIAWPVTNNWSAMGRWQYDLTNKRNLEILSGVEYNSCCYQVRVLWRKWVEDDDNIDHPDSKNGIFLQFVLRGLGDLTGGTTKQYIKGIKGYAGDEK